MRQRGSLTLGLGITIALLSIALSAVGWLYNGALKEKARVQGEYEAFKLVTKRLGDNAEKDRIAKESADKTRKEKADAENAATRKRVTELNRQLRDARSKISALGSPLSATSPSAKRPQIISFIRADLDRTLSEFVAETSRIAEEGDDYRIDLDTAKKWAQE